MNIRLRALEPEDLDFLYELENTESVAVYSSTNVPLSRYALLNYIMSATNDIFTDKQLRLVVETDTGERCGLVDLFDFSPSDRRAEIGVAIHPQWQNKGIATVAVAQLMDYARSTLHLNQLYAIIPVSNIASAAIFHKIANVKVQLMEKWFFIGGNYEDAQLFQVFL